MTTKKEMSRGDLREVVKAFCVANNIVPLCEECFYLTDPECPDFPHQCALKEALNNPEEREWVLNNLLDKVKMLEQLEAERLAAKPTEQDVIANAQYS